MFAFDALSISCRDRSRRHMMIPILLVLFTGSCCWGIYFVRSGTSSQSDAHSNSIDFQAFESTLTESACDDVLATERNETDENSSLANLKVGTDDLDVQSVLLCPARRVAMICDHLVSEGQIVSLQGRSYKVTMISEAGVDMEIAASRFHLPFSVRSATYIESPQD